MELQTIREIELAGFSVRTTNAKEQLAATAKIGQLWEVFYNQALPKLSPDSRIYGVYTNYESDCHGAYDVVACSDALKSETEGGFVKTQIQEGPYIVFAAEGDFPKVVINLWEAIWNYFEADDCSYKRAYTTDFEFYKGAHEVEIYIAVKS
ncbi:GyrI-like domain-containing protein [Vibrio europaeus]|uniref:GyrI-like domain-containing protein n=1 Tax=Vibrio europaeus TaxID=300876 RepID=A0A178JE77_9VIBR|nr:GyrI-like domain-containing protein [Vibrio europaeus]MDC5707648.1 GyrI-like domain-containing protein [Vibrio europaeus]MDC5709894.1 GyrI-like domain-containing protein [Vibrio europaeus]MDC5716629.1 GyrI-like domain-containing protein [Vibrio europaeus]MDC5722751.1 GyrI-like domain-containing protein [Vibrio europaeus]MDC5726949.1 GyrI-like domain-containing protein [Vibrio europaeus]